MLKFPDITYHINLQHIPCIKIDKIQTFIQVPLLCAYGSNKVRQGTTSRSFTSYLYGYGSQNKDPVVYGFEIYEFAIVGLRISPSGTFSKKFKVI